MSVSRSWVSEEENVRSALAMYRSPDCATMQEIADQLSTTFQNVQYVIKACLTEEERKALAMLRYSRSKTGDKNPMLGRTGPAHPRWIGEASDHKGYTTVRVGNKRQFTHRDIVAKALTLEMLPSCFEVHHIDGDGENNQLDNLALVTPKGHKTIHGLQRQESRTYRLRRLRLLEAMKYMTSP